MYKNVMHIRHISAIASHSDSEKSYKVCAAINYLTPLGGLNFVHPPNSLTPCFTCKMA